MVKYCSWREGVARIFSFFIVNWFLNIFDRYNKNTADDPF